MRIRILFFLVIATFMSAGISKSSAAEDFLRNVEFEWEPIEGASSYKIQVEDSKKDTLNKKNFFNINTNIWRGKLRPGNYLIRLQTIDSRGVPSEWGEPTDFKVFLASAKLISPETNAEIQSQEHNKTKIILNWKAVEGATSYQATITSEDETVKIIKKTEVPSLELNLSVAKKYHWSITAQDDNGNSSESIAASDFTINGAPLLSPKIAKPESEFVRQIKWSKPENCQKFDIRFLRRDPIAKKWIEQIKTDDFTSSEIPFAADWLGGIYQLQVVAKAPHRSNSQASVINFKVKSGDRSPNAEFEALVKQSIAHTTGWYGIGSYLLTQMNYEGQNFETGGAANFAALGGTGRLGMGYMKASPWGFLGIIDLSGFIYNGKNHTFASAEFNGTYRLDFGRAEVRLQSGLYFKELPDLTGDPTNQSVLKESKVSGIGPHFGAEFWQSLNPRMGFQTNLHVYYSLIKIATPNDQPLSPTLSYQLGFLGSYKFSPAFTGLMGYAKRVDKVAYQAIVGADSFADTGDKNITTVAGDYINFFAEWNF